MISRLHVRGRCSPTVNDKLGLTRRSCNSALAEARASLPGLIALGSAPPPEEVFAALHMQRLRLRHDQLTFLTDLTGGAEMRNNGAFVQNAISLAGISNEAQPSLWQDRVKLDDGFWKSLRNHPVPVREEAIKAIGPRFMAIDVYIWLAYRLHSMNKATPVSWPAVHAQFGAGFKAIRQMKPVFIDALNLALAVYPEASVDVSPGGLDLHPSPPAVPRAEARRLGLT